MSGVHNYESCYTMHWPTKNHSNRSNFIYQKKYIFIIIINKLYISHLLLMLHAMIRSCVVCMYMKLWLKLEPVLTQKVIMFIEIWSHNETALLRKSLVTDRVIKELHCITELTYRKYNIMLLSRPFCEKIISTYCYVLNQYSRRLCRNTQFRKEHLGKRRAPNKYGTHGHQIFILS